MVNIVKKKMLQCFPYIVLLVAARHKINTDHHILKSCQTCNKIQKIYF